MAVRGDNSLYFASGIDNSGLLQGKAQAVNIIQDLAGSIARINPFAALAVGAAAAFALISKEAYAMAKDFESAMAEVKTIANVTELEFQDLQKSVFGLYRQLGTEPPDKLAKGLYEIIGAGFEASDALKLLEIASKSATAGVTTTEVAADGLTTILNAFQLSTNDAAEVADIMFATVDRGKISFEELSSQIAQVAPLAASSGISFQEIGGALSTLTKQGVPASQAMTQIRSAIISTNEVMGDGVFDVYTLQEAFQAMYETAGGSQNELKEMAGRIEAVNAILSIAGPNFEGATEDLNAMADAAGSVDKSFKIVTSTAANQWDIFFNRLKATTIGIGDNLLAVSGFIAEALNDITEGTDQVIVSLEKERTQMLLTQDALIDVNTTQEDRIKLIEELRKKYPSYFADLKTEEISNDKIKDAVKAINQELLNKIVLQEEANAVNKAQETANEKAVSAAQAEKDLRLEIVELVDRYGLTLKDNLSLVERARDIRSQLPEDELNIRGAGQRITGLIGQLEGARNRADEANSALDRMEKRKREVEIILGINTEDGKGVEKSIQEQLDIIKEATNRDELVEFLKSQNEEIKKAAEERLKYLRSLIEPGPDTDPKVSRPKNLQALGLPSEGVDLDINFVANTDSIRFIERHLQQLREKWELASAEDRPSIKVWIDYWQERVDEARKGTDKIADLQKELNYDLDDLSLGALKKEKEKWKEKLKLYKDGSEESVKATELIMAQIDAIAQREGDKIQEIFAGIAGSFREAQSLFENFGASEDVTELLGTLGELASAAGNIASGNPAQIVQGSFQALNAVFKSGVDSNTAMFEKAIKDLEKTIDKLDYTISKSVGGDRVTNRLELIEQYRELEEQANKAAEAESNARKEIKYLGITIAKKGRGSGTDQAKLDELQEKAEEARREVEALNDELNEIYTGTTQKSIADSIISGLREGKKEVKEFADTFEELMQNAMLNAFRTKYLEGAISGFYDKFAEAGEDSVFTPAEIQKLRDAYSSILSRTQKYTEGINEVLEGMNLDPLGGDVSKQGLSGSISTITEDTANILAGTLNAIRLDVQTSTDIAMQSSEYLATISQGVTNYLPFLQSIDGRLANIENGNLQLGAQG